jgi:CheY-like chemotaxis protein
MKKQRILIADDDRAFLNLLQARFSALGYEVTTATNGQDALSLACDETPNALILDINMPGTDFMVHRCKRQIGTLRLKPVIYVTGASGGPLDLARKLGAYAVLRKPIDFWRLADVVKTAIQMDGDPQASMAARGKSTD